MLYAAIIDDEQSCASTLERYLQRYAGEKSLQIRTAVFSDPVEFLTKYQPVYDMVFMDIEMPHINGFETAQRLRELDPAVALVFVTGYAQYAPRGYEVNAAGYLVKPVSYLSFYTLVEKMLRVSARDRDAELIVRLRDGVRVLRHSEIEYIEISGHSLRYFTERGTVEATGSMAKLEEVLPADAFARPSNSFIVHLKFVRGVTGNDVHVGDQLIPISRARKKDFMAALMRYYGDRA